MRRRPFGLTTARSGLQATVPLYLDGVAVDEQGFITEWQVAYLPRDVDPGEITRALANSVNLDEPHRCQVYDAQDRYLAGHPGNPAAAHRGALARLARRGLAALRRASLSSGPAVDTTVAEGVWPDGLLGRLTDDAGVQDPRGRLATAGRVRVEWVELGEGADGDHDPNDPDDVELLRFDFSALLGGQWVTVSDASYCTHVPVTTDAVTRQRLLAILLLEGAPAVEAGLDALLAANAGVPAVAEGVSEVAPAGRRIFERLSWISPDWAA